MSFICPSCRLSRETPFAQCPRCKTWNVGVAKERESVTDDSDEVWSPKKLSQIKLPKIERVDLKDAALNALFGGGMVKSCSYLFSAPPGFGKSSWALQACQFFDRPLYITAEETEKDLKLRAKRFAIDVPQGDFQECRNLERVAKNITTEYDGVIYDSAHRFYDPESSSAPAGSTVQTNCAIALMHDMARKLGHVAVIIGQVNKDQIAAGSMANQHDVTGVITGQKMKRGIRRMRMEKHRHGPDTSQLQKQIECVLTAHGLDDFRLIDDDDVEKEED